MKITRVWRAVGAVVASTSLIALAACGSTDDTGDAGDEGSDPLRVGLLFSHSGPAAPFGISERNGAWSVLTKANEEGGINGTKIEIFEEDDKSDPTEAAQAARRLIMEDKVDVIIGTSGTASTMAFAPIAASNNVPILATSGSIDITSKDHDYWEWLFRSATSDKIALERVFEETVKAGHTRIGVFAEETPYGDASRKHLDELVAELPDVEIVAVAGAEASATDFSPQATRIRNADPDVVLMVTGAPSLGAGFTRAFRQDGSEVPIWGTQGLAQEGYVTAAGEAAEGARMVSPNNWAQPDADTQALIDLLAEYDFEGTSFESAGAHGAQVVIAAAEKIDGEINGESLRDALTTVCIDTLAIGGEVCYTEEERDGIGVDGFVVTEIQGGKFVLIP